MKAYIDTSFLIKLYYPEPETEVLAKWVLHNKVTAPFTPLHDLEMKNAMALKLYRSEIAREEFDRWLSVLYEDKRIGALRAVSPDWGAVFLRAEELARSNTPAIGCRSLDILHVALALELAYDTFLTNDAKQSTLALSSGLNVPRLS